MASWGKGRGLIAPLRPLIGEWRNHTAGPPDGPQSAASLMRCTRTFRPFGKGWVELDARWDRGLAGEYLEIAMFGAVDDGVLGFCSFTNDGTRSEGRVADGTDVHPDAMAFEAQMPAGLARMIYWPLETGKGFYFAVESRTQKGWNRFLRHEYRPV